MRGYKNSRCAQWLDFPGCCNYVLEGIATKYLMPQTLADMTPAKY